MWNMDQRQTSNSVRATQSAPAWLVFPFIRLLSHRRLSTTTMPDLLRLLPASLGLYSLAGMALIWRDVGSKMKGEMRTVVSLLGQYVAVKAAGWLGERQRGKKLPGGNSAEAPEDWLHIRYGTKHDFSNTGEKTS